MTLAWKRAAKLYFEQYKEAMRLKNHHQAARYEAERQVRVLQEQLERTRTAYFEMREMYDQARAEVLALRAAALAPPDREP